MDRKLLFPLFLLVLLAVFMFLSVHVDVKGQEQTGSLATPSTVASLTGPPVGFSETSSTVRLNFTMFIIQFDKSSGSSIIYAKNGSVLVYYHFMFLQYYNDKVKDWRQAGTFQSLSWIKHDDYHYSVTELFQDASTTPRTNYTITYDIRSDSRVKISIRIESGASRQYRLVWSFGGIVYSSWREVKNSDNVKCQLCFGNETQPYSFVKFDWQDVYEQFKSDIASYSVTTSAQGKKADIYFDIGTVSANSVLTVDPSLVGTSTTSDATTFPNQRKSFYASGRFWVFYSDGTNMVYRTSTDGSTWSAATTVRAASYGYYFSVWFDGTYLHYAYAYNSPIYYRRGTPNSDGTITWSAAEQTVSTTYSKVIYPMVSVDSNGYVWVGYIDYTGSASYPYVIKSGNNDGTWGTTPSGFPYQLSTTGAVWVVSVIPLTSGKMLAIYAYDGATIKAKRWDGSAWGTEVATTTAVRINRYYSAVAQGDDVCLVFQACLTYNIVYTKYVYSSNSFSAETTLATGADLTTVPVISVNSTTNDLYVFAATKTTNHPSGWTANHIYYTKYTASSGTWGSWVDWIDETTETLYSADTLTCFYRAYSNNIGLVYLTRTASPYNVKFARLLVTDSPPNAPTLTGPAVYWRFNPGASVTFSWTFSDPDSGDSQSAYRLQIGNSGFTTIYLDTGKITSTSTSKTVTLPSNMTVGDYYWRVTTWDTYGGVQGAWSSGRNIKVDRIKVNSLTADDTRRDVGSTATLSVQLVYEYDSAYITSGSFTLNGLTLTYSGSNGVWRTTSSQSVVTAVTYNSVAGTEGTYGLTVVNMNYQAVTVIWDKVQFTLTVADDRINVGDSAQISVTAKYAYDNTAFQGFYSFNDTLTKTTVGKWGFKVASITDSLYGLTAFESNAVSVIWDRIKVNSLSADKSRRNVGSTVTLSVQLVYEYDSGYITSGTFTLNGLTLSYSGSNGVWRATDSKSTVQAVTYNSVSGTEGTYSLTTVNMNSQSVTVIWDGLKLSQYILDLQNQLVKVQAVYAYDNQPIANANVSYAGLYVLTNSTGWAVFNASALPSVGWNSVAYPVSEPTYGLTYKAQNQTIAFHKLQVQPFTIRANNFIGSPVWDDINRKLTFTTSGTCIVKTGDWGQPLWVEVDGTVYTNWTYNSISQEVSIFNLHSNVALIWQSQAGAPGGAPGGVSPTPAPASTPPAEIPTIIPSTSPSLVNVGIVLIVAVVAGAFIYSQTGKAKTLDEAWRKRSKASAKTVSLKPSGKKSVSWKRKSRFRTLEE